MHSPEISTIGALTGAGSFQLNTADAWVWFDNRAPVLAKGSLHCTMPHPRRSYTPALDSTAFRSVPIAMTVFPVTVDGSIENETNENDPSDTLTS
jgi:hypothetical protein